MMDLNQMAQEAFRMVSPEGLEGLSFGIKAIYVMIYFGITWKLLNVAQQKIEGAKKKQRGE